MGKPLLILAEEVEGEALATLLVNKLRGTLNAGVEGAVIVMEVKKNKKAAYGFNAATEGYLGMLSAGIIDPTNLTRTALQNAASIAGLMITAGCEIADKPEEDRKMGGTPPCSLRSQGFFSGS